MIILKGIRFPGISLSQRTVRGGFWVFLLRIFQRLFSLARLLILARILAPHDFGLMGIALLTMSTLMTFSQTGFQQALIQKRGNIESYLDAAWTISILRGLFLFGILFFSAPFAASFFDTPDAKTIIRVISITVLIGAFTNIGIINFQKELQFNKEIIYQISETIADFAVAILLVFIIGNVWALVYGAISGKAVSCVMSYLLYPYRPRLSIDFAKTKELFVFGKWILITNIIIYLLTQGDDIFVGKYLGVASLGFYQLAYTISNLSATEITHVASMVAFPAYSKLQGDLPKLRNAYSKVLQLTTFLSFPIAGLTFVLAPDFTKIFLGEKWMPMVSAMQVLCLFGLTRSVNGTIGSIFLATGVPKILTIGAGIQLLILAVIIYPLTNKWGIMGTSLAVTIPNILVLLYLVKKLEFSINYKIRSFSGSLIPSLVGSFLVCGAISFLINFWDKNFITILFFILIGICAYMILMYYLDRLFNYGLKNNLLELFEGVTGK